MVIGLEAAVVEEVRLTDRAYPVPAVPDHVLGLTTWRGRVLPLVDVALALDLADDPDRVERARVGLASGELRVMVVLCDDLLVGLVWDGLIGVVRVDPETTSVSASAPGRLQPSNPRELAHRDSLAYLVDAFWLLEMAQPGQ